MNVRLQQFIAAENITQAQLADLINVARGSVSHVISGRNKPSFEFIAGLARCFPNLNMDWILTGQGKMYKTVSAAPAAAYGRQNAPQEGDLLPFMPDDDLPDESEESPLQSAPQPSSAPAGQIQVEPLQQTPSNRPPAASQAPQQAIASQVAQEPTTPAPQAPADQMPMTSQTLRQRKAVKVVIFYDDNSFQEVIY